MRDKLIHDYMSVNLQRVFETVTTDLPPLKTALIEILSTYPTSIHLDIDPLDSQQHIRDEPD